MGQGDWCCRAGRLVLCGGAGRVVMWGRDKWYCGAGTVVMWVRESDTHDGRDELLSCGTELMSCGAGTVVMSGRDSGHDGQG